MHTARPLRHALLANATFSLGVALVLVAAPSPVGDLLGVDAPGLLRFLGFGLALFGADLVHQATRERVTTWRALYASALDVLWVVGTAGLLLARPESLSLEGTVVALSVAGMVAVFAAWQLWAIDRAHAGSYAGSRRHCVAVRAAVSADAMWGVLGDIGRIDRFTPSLASSEIVGDEDAGVGAVRRCVDVRGHTWAEACVAYEPGRSFTMRFLAEAPDFPFPARSMTGGWTLVPDGSHTRVEVWWELEPRPRYASPVLMPLFAWRADRAIPEVVRGMARTARGRPEVEDPWREKRGFGRPRPRAC